MTDPTKALVARLRELEAACPHIDPHPCETEYDFGSQYFNTSDDYAGYCVRKNLSDVGDKLRNALPALLSAIEAQAAEVARYREAMETIQTVADNERMDATDAHYAVILAGIQQTARAALATDPRSELAKKGDAR